MRAVEEAADVLADVAFSIETRLFRLVCAVLGHRWMSWVYEPAFTVLDDGVERRRYYRTCSRCWTVVGMWRPGPPGSGIVA